jgi:hypothetical protein
MGLSGSDHEAVDLRPPAFAAWIESGSEVDALVLDLDNPRLAAAAVSNLRAHAKLAPVLLVSSDRPGWDDPGMHNLPGTEVLPLPVNRAALLAALDDLLLPPAAAPMAHAPHHRDVVQALQELVIGPEALLADDEDDVPVPRHRRPIPPVGSEPVREPPTPVPAAPIAATPTELRTPPAGALTDSDTSATGVPLSSVPRTQRRAGVPAVDMTASLQELQALRPPRTTPPPPPRHSSPPDDAIASPVAAAAPVPAPSVALRPEGAAELVRQLLGIADTLFGVPETAQVVISDAVERTKADAGALLVPDGDQWRVAAGVGLRPLEHRYQLDEDSWLVEQVGRAHKGVIIEESDVAREQLHGAPLASWRHLLAAPVPDIHAVLLLARHEDPPFDESDLAGLAALGIEAQPLLSAAVETRALARALWEFRDDADSSP